MLFGDFAVLNGSIKLSVLFKAHQLQAPLSALQRRHNSEYSKGILLTKVLVFTFFRFQSM